MPVSKAGNIRQAEITFVNNIKYSPARRSQSSPCTQFHTLALTQKVKEICFRADEVIEIHFSLCFGLMRSEGEAGLLFSVSSLTQMG